MNPLQTTGLLVLVFIAAALTGWQTKSSRAEVEQAEKAAPAPTKHSQRGRRQAGKAAVPADVAARLAPVYAARTPVERMRATIELANSLPVSELERWYAADWFNFNDGMDGNFFYRITRARWLGEDPQGLMAFFLRRNNEHLSEVAHHWAKCDPSAAVAFLDGIRDPKDATKLAQGMMPALGEADPVLALGQISKLRDLLGGRQDWLLGQMLAGVAKSSPELLASEVAGWPASLRSLAEKQIDIADFRRDFPGTIAGLRDSPDGKRRFLEALEQGGDLAKKLTEHAADLPDGWFAEAATASSYHIVRDDPAKWLEADLAAQDFTEVQARSMKNSAAQALASKEPQRALEMLAREEIDEVVRSRTIQGAMRSLAEKDSAAAEAWLARFTEEADISAARQGMDGIARKTPTPEEWLADISGADLGNRYQRFQDAGNWDQGQVAAARVAFDHLPDEEKRGAAESLMRANSRQLDPGFHANALSYLVENPPPTTAGSPVQQARNPLVQGVSQLASNWAAEDPAAASRWVKSLPPGEERLWAAKNLAVQWAEYEPSAARQWAAGLPSDERKEVESCLEGGGRNP